MFTRLNTGTNLGHAVVFRDTQASSWETMGHSGTQLRCGSVGIKGLEAVRGSVSGAQGQHHRVQRAVTVHLHCVVISLAHTHTQMCQKQAVCV